MPDANADAVFTDTPIRPPSDAELVPVMEAALKNYARFTPESLPIIRQSPKAFGMAEPDLTAGGSVTLEERQVPGPAGEPDVTVLILRPRNAAAPLPGIYHTHGGGMVIGDRTTGVDKVLPYVAEGKAVAVSVEYRLAPEHPDPAPVEDCYAGLVWTAGNASELGIDPDRLIIAGGSAGGGLAAGTALLARDRGFPALSHQVLMCPMLDDRLQTHSSRMLDNEGTWDRNDNLFGWTALLGDRRGGPDVSPYAAPARADDLAGLPRTYIDCGATESFRDEATLYATRLSQAGVPVDFHLWGGGFHGFESAGAHAPVARASIAVRDEFFRRAIEP